VKPGRQIGAYVIERELGRGAMGRVYLARHAELGSKYALKVLPNSLAADRTAQRRFEIEMESLGRVDGHPGIVRVHSAGRTPGGRPYFAMEFVAGEPFSQRLKEGMSRADALEVVEQVAGALAHAHTKGLVHRDVKPDNVLVGADGVARLTDFGLARLLYSEESLTRSSDMLGTPFYLAPEQAKPALGPVGPWSDVYSVGAVLYEVLTGQPPHVGKTSAEVIQKVLKDPIVPPSLRVEGVPKALEQVCLRALARAPGDRYAGMEELLTELRPARAGLAGGDEAVTAAEPAGAPPPARSGRGVWLLAALAALSLASGGLALALRGGGADPAARARELEQAVGALDRRLQPGADLEALLRDVAALSAEAAPADGADEGAAPEDAALVAARAELAALEDRVRAALAAHLYASRRDVARAAEVLGDGRPDPLPEELARVLLLGGDPAGALAAAPDLPPRARAWAAAWAGDAPAARAALAGLPAARARALAATLRADLPGLAVPPAEPGETDAWDLVAAAEAALAEGATPLAAIDFARAAPGEADAALEAAVGLGRARVALARGELDAAAELAAAAAERDPDPLGRLRGLLLVGELAAASAAPVAFAGEDALEVASREAPGAPPIALGRWRRALRRTWADDPDAGTPATPGASPLGPAVRLRPLDRARGAARGGRAAEALALAQDLAGGLAERSFTRLELRLCRAGLDGPPGLLLVRAVDLARFAAAGGSRAAAEQALDLLERAGRLRPESPVLWLARSAAARTLHATEQALRTAERGLDLAPGDPAALLARARALEARLEEGAAALADLDEEEGLTLQADEARGRGIPLAQVEARLAARLDDVRAAYRAAAVAAEAGSPLAAEARLGAARALLERARRRAYAEGGPVAAPDEDRRAVTDLLEPLLAEVDLAALERGRAALARALRRGDAERIAAAEDALVAAGGPGPGGAPPEAIEALALRARAGGDGAGRAARACLALAGDLPARALHHQRLALSPGGDEALLERARRLDPRLPHAALIQSFRSGDDALTAGLEFARVVAEAPEWTTMALVLLTLRSEHPTFEQLEAAAERARSTREQLAVALAVLGAIEVNAGASWSSSATGPERDDRLRRFLTIRDAHGRLAYATLQRLRREDPGQAGLCLLQAAALAEVRTELDERRSRRAIDAAVLPDRRHALDCFRAALPWSTAPVMAELAIGGERSLDGLARDLLAAGYLSRAGHLAEARRAWAGRQALARHLKPIEALVEGLDLRDPAGLLAAAEGLRRRSAVGSLLLRLAAERRRVERRQTLDALLAGTAPADAGIEVAEVAAWLGGDPPLADLDDLLAALPAEVAPLAARARAHAAATAESGTPERSALRQALLAASLAAPAGEVDRLRPRQLRAAGIPLRLPPEAASQFHDVIEVIQPDPALWEERYRLEAPEVATALVARLAGGDEGAPFEAALEPWSPTRRLLGTVQESREQERLLPWLLRHAADDPTELVLALERAAGFARGDPDATACRLAAWLRGAVAAAPAAARRDATRAALALVRRAAARSDAPPRLRGTAADLELDLAGLAEEGEARRTHLERARADLADAPRHRVLASGEDPALLDYRLVRFAAATGDGGAAAEAAARLAERLAARSAPALALRGWVAVDPLRAALRATPALAEPLGALLGAD